VHSPEPTYTTILPEPLQAFPVVSSSTVAPQVSPQIVSQIVTPYPVIPQPPPSVQSQQIQLPSTSSKITTQSPLLKTPSFVPHVAPLRVKSIMSPTMKIQQQAPTIYSVMYTGHGNKITLKRKTIMNSDEQSEPINNSNNDVSNLFHLFIKI
jgi:hypothetical protein